MPKVDVESWIHRLAPGNWRIVDQNIDAVALELKSRVPSELHDRINRAVAKSRQSKGIFQAMIVLDGDRETGEQLFFMVSLGPIHSPDHIHGGSPDDPYGEKCWTLAGVIDDVADDGSPFIHEPNNAPFEHGPGTRHQPYVSRYWIGIVHQPKGSRLA